MEHSTNDVNARVKQTIGKLLSFGFDGCIAGSCVLEDDFNKWDSEPDVDFFAYSHDSWLYAVACLAGKEEYKMGSLKDKWKLTRISQGKSHLKNRYITETMYLLNEETGIYLNLSYKPGTQSILDVLARFDMISIMVGICCRTGVKVDLRQAFGKIDEPLPLSTDGQANPVRLWYMMEGWGEDMWSRELSRILKYQSRGYDMKPMANDLIGVAATVLDRGETVGSEKSKARYLNLLLSCYRPIVWLENFIQSLNPEEDKDLLSDYNSNCIYNEILHATEGLPKDETIPLFIDLITPLVPENSKMFTPEEEELDDTPQADR